MNRTEFCRVGTGTSSSQSRRDRSEVYPHSSSQLVRPWLLPAAPAYSDASASMLVPFDSVRARAVRSTTLRTSAALWSSSPPRLLNTRPWACSRSLATTLSSFGGSCVKLHHASTAALMVVLPSFFGVDQTTVSYGRRRGGAKGEARRNTSPRG